MNLAFSFTSIFTNNLLSSLRTSNYRTLAVPMAFMRTLTTTTTHVLLKRDKKWRRRDSGGSNIKIHACHSSRADAVTNFTNDGYPEYGRLLPCPSQNGLPRIEHIVVSEGGPVLDYITKTLNLPPRFVADLIHFGAVYYALVCPNPPPSATPEQIRLFKEVTAPSVLRTRPSIKGKTVREAQKTFRITHVTEFVETGTYLRVHIHPKRFPRCYEIDWKSRVIAVAESYVVLDKPAGTSTAPHPLLPGFPLQEPSHQIFITSGEGRVQQHERILGAFFCLISTPKFVVICRSYTVFVIEDLANSELSRTAFRIVFFSLEISACLLSKASGGRYLLTMIADLFLLYCYLALLGIHSSSFIFQVGGTTDNIEESCATFTTRALGLKTPLKTTHQIDNCSEGCVVFARTKEYCSVFHGKIREKKVKKLYLALAAAPVLTGIITHYMRPVNMAPRLVSKDFSERWHQCQLEVLECKEVPWPNAITEEKYCIDDCGWPSKDVAYECKINLLTGRTHQIRAQLAACGAPIVGDSMYTPSVLAEKASPGTNPFGEHGKQQYESEDAKIKSVEEWIAQHGKEPSVAIGLQACQISWDDGEHIYEARSPWWR
ncbi:hypothetical protein GIB67_035892 [Kingdonia uniflora]|uniref:Pseudouridine synthase RsuA/RluA-like domain-containing protein n=1 Tax=Kingdonia uniflora TaxID=39325 RepID=A0A7J7P8I8_9MAGN|nr:hypothetical protein GIB67_035892 [Kingdonia uniflora]